MTTQTYIDLLFPGCEAEFVIHSIDLKIAGLITEDEYKVRIDAIMSKK